MASDELVPFPEQTPLLQLDDPLLAALLALLDTPADVLSLAATCRRLTAVLRDPSHAAPAWARLLQRNFGLSPRRGADSRLLRAQLEQLHLGHSAPLPFRGVFSNGGVDGGDGADGRYTVDKLFSAHFHESYCSARSSNVTTLAVLDAPHAPDPAAAALRAWQLERCRLPGSLLFGDPQAVRRGPGRRLNDEDGFAPEPDLSRWNPHELDSLFLQLCGLLQQGHGMGRLLLAGVPAAAVAAERVRCFEHAARILAARQAEVVGLPADWWVAPEAPDTLIARQPLPAPRPAVRVASVTQLTVSRVGQFSCPLACGCLLLATLDTSQPRGEAEARGVLADLAAAPRVRALDDVTSVEAVLEAVAEGRLPPVLRQGEAPAGRWVEFAPLWQQGAGQDPAQLWPAVWFMFTPRPTAVALALALEVSDPEAAADVDRFDILRIPLGARHGGNVAAVQLIGSENLMTAWGDNHAEPNMDVNSVEIAGLLAEL